MKAKEVYNAITAYLRDCTRLSDTQRKEIGHLLNELWDAADAEARIDQLP